MASTHDYADDDMVGTIEGAEVAGVSPNTLRRWADLGRIPAYRTPGNLRRFKVGDLRNHTRREQPRAAADSGEAVEEQQRATA